MILILMSACFVAHPQAASAGRLKQALVSLSGAQPESKALPGKSFSGNVSWYGPHFNGKKTASGEVFDMQKTTAAHRTLPFFVKVLVEDPKSGNSVIVKVNDRGPFARRRVMDLSKEGGRKLGILGKGLTYADCLVLD